jgi:hypothetical protein
MAPVIPEYPGLTFLQTAAADLAIHPARLRQLLRELGLKTEERPGSDAYSRVVHRTYVRNSDLEEVKKNRKPGRPIDEEITVEEAAGILWPDEAKELKQLRPDRAAYDKLREKHLGRVYHLIRQELLTPLDEAHKRLFPSGQPHLAGRGRLAPG